MTGQDDQKKLQSLLVQIRSYQATLQEMARQTALAERAIDEIAATIEAIEQLPKTKESEALIPLGSGVFAKAELLDKKNFIVTAGAGVHLEKTVAETKKFLEERKARLEANDKMLREQAERLSIELENANQIAEELYAKLQGK